MKKVLIFLLFIVSGIFSTYAGDNELTILDVDSSNSNLLKVFVDNEIEAKDNKLTSDVKLFKDLSIENISRDLDDSKKVNVVLKDSITKNTSYSLLPISGVDGNIDFKVGDLINGLEITGSDLDGVDKLLIKDDKHLEIIFSKVIEADQVDLKILKEYKIGDIFLNSDNKKEIDVKLDSELEKNTSYLLMIFSFINSDNVEYSINNYIFDFKTSEELSEANIKNDNKIAKEAQLNNVALNSANTPETGPETWILVLFTFILSSIIYFRKKA